MAVGQLPPGRIQFFDANGDPLIGGFVYSYIPTTLITKTTYQDSNGVIPNTNPIVLDGLGSAVIWGSGSYRQIVTDFLGNVIWDEVTSSNGSGSSGPDVTGLLITSSGGVLFPGPLWGFRTSLGAFSATLPALSSVTQGTVIATADVDNNASANNYTIVAASGDSIVDYATTTTTYVVSINNLLTSFVALPSVWRVLS